jgi:glutathione peroxidase
LIGQNFLGRSDETKLIHEGEKDLSVYSFQAKLSNGEEISLETYKGKVVLIVNTASKCGFTPQYEGLEKLYETYKDNGFTIVGFPCNQFGGQEPGSNEEISSFCSLNYNVTFPIFQKIDVNGENAHPLYQYLREQAPEDSDLDKNGSLYKLLRDRMPELLEGTNIRWNFTKFLIDQNGNVVKRFASTTKPEDIAEDIEKLLVK